MKKIVALCVLSLGWPCFSLAQSDPTTMTLLNSGQAQGLASASDNGLETNRYVKKPKSNHKKKRSPASDNSASGAGSGVRSDASSENEAPAPVSDLQNSQVAPLPRLGGGPAVSDSFNDAGAPQPTFDGAAESGGGFGSRMRDMFLGGDLDSISKYRSFLDYNDVRKNILELSLAATYLYNTSLSPYFYRNYITSAPGAYVGMDFWLTPFFGIDADYRSTLLDDVKDSPSQDIYVSDSQTWYGLGLKFRRFFGMAVNSPSMSLALKYTNFNFGVSRAAQDRLSTTSQGIELAMDVKVPAGRNYSWNFGALVDPYINLAESTSGSQIQSGSSNQTVGLGINVGGESRVSRQTQVFFKLSALVYKSLYSGTSSNTDPVTGNLELNVPVNNIFYMLDLGVRWVVNSRA